MYQTKPAGAAGIAAKARQESAAQCFHCRLPVPDVMVTAAAARQDERLFCCPGCEAVSRSIADLGLDDYYRLRDASPPRLEREAADPAAFDEPSIEARYVTSAGNGVVEARLLVEGMRCAACAWLIEQTLCRMPEVESVGVQFAARRLTVRWRRDIVPPSALIRAIARIGYAAWPFEEGRVATLEAAERRRLLRRLWVAGLGMMQVMMYAFPSWIALDGEMGADVESLMRWAGMLLTIPVLLYSATPFVEGAWRDIRMRTLGMDVPIVLGIAVAFAASAWSTIAGRGPVYFDSVTMFVFLLLGARYLEVIALGRAGRALLGLGRIVPAQAHRLCRGDSLATDTVLAAALAAGDRVLVRPGETIPADGILESDFATVNEAWMSGESRPVLRRKDAAVLCGAVNAGSALIFTVTQTGTGTALSGILGLIERSLAEKPHWIASAERAVPVFVGAVLAASLVALIAWLFIDPARALSIAVAVLIVTCPCALALATPVAMTVATGALARANVALTRGGAIEALAAATDVVFDKTGTLTSGTPELVGTLPVAGCEPGYVLTIAAALAQGSSHPFDAALRQAAATAGLRIPLSSGHRSEPGRGIEAVIDGVRHRAGRADYVAEIAGPCEPGVPGAQGAQDVQGWQDARGWQDAQGTRIAPFVPGSPSAGFPGADSQVWLASERGWIALFSFRDTPRAAAGDAVAALQAMGVSVHLLSGDNERIAQSVAAELGIRHVRAQTTPDEKCAYVRALQAAGARVAMVGDGINDAPVLAQADVSIAMNSGADLAKVRADAVLLSDSPADLPAALRIARRTRAVIRQNLGWALGYNLIAIPLAVTGHLSPLIAGIGMSASSLLVVANSLRAR